MKKVIHSKRTSGGGKAKTKAAEALMMKATSLDDDIEINFDAGKESDDEDGFIAQRKKALKRQKLKNKEDNEEDDDEEEEDAAPKKRKKGGEPVKIRIKQDVAVFS